MNIRKKGIFVLLPMILIVAMVIGLGSSSDSVNASSHEYYVDPVNGSDLNSGIASNDAFATVQHAHDQTDPGDIVYLMNGTHDTEDGQGVLRISRSGTASDYITYKHMVPGNHDLTITKRRGTFNSC